MPAICSQIYRLWSAPTPAASPRWAQRRRSAIDLGQEAGGAIGLMDGRHWPLSTGVRSSVVRRDLATARSRRLTLACARFRSAELLRVGNSSSQIERASDRAKLIEVRRIDLTVSFLAFSSFRHLGRRHLSLILRGARPATPGNKCDEAQYAPSAPSNPFCGLGIN